MTRVHAALSAWAHTQRCYYTPWMNSSMFSGAWVPMILMGNESLPMRSSPCITPLQCGKPKKCHKMHGEAYPRVDLNDMDGLECLAWAVYDGVFLPGNPPALTGHHDWQWIIVGTILRLVYWGATAGAHCPHAQSPHTTLSRPLSGKVPHGTLGGSSPRLHGHLLC